MMKILNYYILIFAITITNASFSFAKAGPPIPIPKNPAIEAIKIARQRFYLEFPDNKRFTESEDLKIEDFIVMNAVYTKSYKSYKFHSSNACRQPPLNSKRSGGLSGRVNGLVRPIFCNRK